MKIDCHIIFNAETDRPEWLARCVASLEHPDVAAHVHKFYDRENVRRRRSRILEAHDSQRWIMFADPDDFAVQPGYNNFIEHLKTTSLDVAWPQEIIGDGETDFGVSNMPHHLVALRGDNVGPYPESRHYFADAVNGNLPFSEVAYYWVRHKNVTLGYYDGN